MGIGLIRTLLAISVVLSHTSPIAGYNVANGYVGVELFFMISGFYMALILNEKYVGSGSTWVFYTNRFLRLYPVYWFVLFVSVFIAAASMAIFGPSKSYCLQPWYEYRTSLSFLQYFYLAGTNVFLFGLDTAFLVNFDFSNGFFSLATHYTKPYVYEFLIILPAWSLGVELLFYCMAPHIVRPRARKLLVTIAALSLALRVVLLKAGYSWDPWNYHFFPCTLVFFCAGSLAYSRYRALKAAPPPLWVLRTITLAAIGALLAFNYLPGDFAVRQWCYYLVFIVALPYVFQYSKTSHIDRFVGELSYPIYIVHIFVCAVARRFCHGGSVYGMLAVAGSIAAAVALYLGIQRPIENYRQRRVAVSPPLKLEEKPCSVA